MPRQVEEAIGHERADQQSVSRLPILLTALMYTDLTASSCLPTMS